MTEPAPDIHSPSGHLKATRLLVMAMVTGVTIFGVLVWALYETGVIAPARGLQKTRYFLPWLAGGLSIVLGWIAITGYQKKLTELKNTARALHDRLNQHRIALIRYMALCEGAALFSIVCYFLTGHGLLPVLALLMITVMISKWPTREKLTRELALDMADQLQFDKPI